MKKFELLAASALALSGATPALSQTASTTSSQNTAPTNGPGQEAQTGQSSAGQASAPAAGGTVASGYPTDIVVTAQRQSQRLQDVPIAVSAFTADNLAKQQIVNPLALQQSLPNVTFTKTNFTTSSFTIRGIGDLCTGTTCDSATAIHVNDMPLVVTRLFEGEFFDLERVEVLRGPQGTLFGRNATSGVVNFISAKPDLTAIHAAGEFEYGNYDSKKVKGMFNLPLTDTLGIRVAGTYLNRDGYTYNAYNQTRVDGRDLYSVRGTLSWAPDADTRLDLIGYYFHENDNRARSQKQLCHRDPTGVLGCLPDKLAYETVNGNSTLAAIQSSSQFLALATGSPAAAAFGLGSLYGRDTLAGSPNPADVRTVYDDYNPTYYAMEQQYQAKLFHDFGKISLNITGGYAENRVDSTEDYTQAVESSLSGNRGLATLQTYAGFPGAAFPGGVNPFAQLAAKLIPQGATGPACQSAPTSNDGGVYSGASLGCYAQSLDVDRSDGLYQQWSIEAHVDSKFDGPFNFLLGGIYLNQTVHQNDYYVNAFGLDYASGILPALARSTGTIPAALGPVLFASPFYRNNEERYRLKSYGIFGETYFAFTDKLKLTLGLRYNHDDKSLTARNTYLVDTATPTAANPLLPYGATNLSQAYNYAGLDFDATLPGAQQYANASVGFSRVTGRGVLDYRITDNNLVYFSYSRGYKSGGINPPIPASFAVPSTFAPEKVDSFELGSKNTFLGGALRLNLTGFYYKYKELQLARIVARTAVNDNVSADIYGLEAEAVVSPVPRFVVNANFSYLHSRVSQDKLIADPRDPSGGRSDAVIIKDATNSSNCAVASNVGSALAARGFVNAVNAATGVLQPAVQVLDNGTYGAFSVCSALQAASAGPGAAALGGITVYGSGVPVNIRGNQLPQAPMFKASMGAQYTIDFGNGMTVVPRADLNLTGNSYGSIFNLTIDRIPAYEVVNAQVQLNGRDERWYVRAFVQNATNNSAVTGQYVTDQSSGLFTNIFTLEPRRYGAAIGFKF
jgi:outer membrane receptor protein involved in Fe transport